MSSVVKKVKRLGKKAVDVGVKGFGLGMGAITIESLKKGWEVWDRPRAEAAEAAQAQQKAQEEMMGAQREQARLEQRIRQQQLRRERVQSIREGRVQRGRVGAGAEHSGVAMSSSASGALGSIRSQLGSGLAFSSGIEELQSRITASNIAASERSQEWLAKATQHSIKSQELQGRINLGTTLFGWGVAGRFG